MLIACVSLSAGATERERKDEKKEGRRRGKGKERGKERRKGNAVGVREPVARICIILRWQGELYML